MLNKVNERKCILSIIIPCFNEFKTLKKCIENVLAIESEDLLLEIIIVDDASTDGSLSVAEALRNTYSNVTVLKLDKNQGKGAAIRTGVQKARGDFVAIQDADLEYDPQDLKRLVIPLIKNEADVVLGSRFLSPGYHRVLYYWHSLGNNILTLMSNMFTDLNLTDVECGYKVFKRKIIQAIKTEENRFGFEPEIVAKIAHMRVRIFEIGISYRGRTYEEGKKVGIRDGIRAIYCIVKYNSSHSPLPVQFALYATIGTFAAFINLIAFLTLFHSGLNVTISVVTAFISAATVNYFLCIAFLFRHKARWNSFMEVFMFVIVVICIGLFDLIATRYLLYFGLIPLMAKSLATFLGLFLNYAGRRFLVFPEPTSGPWKMQVNN